MESPCRYNSGSTSFICGDSRTHAGRIADENRCRSPVSGSIRLSDPGSLHADRPRGGQHTAFVVVAVAHHQAATVLVDLISELLDIGGDTLRGSAAASICRAPSRTISSSNDRPPSSLERSLSCTTVSTGVPSQPALPRWS